MAVHPVDVVALMVGLITSASLSYLVYTDSGTELSCHFPAYFTDNNIQHSMAACHSQNAGWYALIPDATPNFTDKAGLRAMYNHPKDFTTLFLADGAVAIFFFMLATNAFSNNSAGKSGGWMIVYASFEGIALISWLGLGIKSHVTRQGHDQLPSPFLCDFAIRQMGSVTRHSVQCRITDNTLDFVLQVNVAVCFSLAAGVAGHVLLTLVAIFHCLPESAGSNKQEVLKMETQSTEQ